ncbi:MAG: class I SAM-dependent methyltransferase [bacterium]|nr:class I SAM-dependent methyltransferase [bacterium]
MDHASAAELPPGFESLPCPICGETSFRRHAAVSDRLDPSAHRGNPRPQGACFAIVTCASCGFLYLNPRPAPEKLPDYYCTTSYDPHRRRGGGLVGALFRWVRPMMIRWKIKRVSRGITTGALLDVGCGTGEFLCAMKASGWMVQGIELDREAARIASESGCQVRVGDPADQLEIDERFELITLWHSLEHLPRLQKTAARMAAVLKPGGRIAIALPNPFSLEARIYGPFWVAWDAPRHLYHFRRDDLAALLEPLGLRWRRTYSLPLDPFYHCLLSEMSWSRGWIRMLRAARGLMIGSLSFLAGMKPAWGSSCLYIFEKV